MDKHFPSSHTIPCPQQPTFNHRPHHPSHTDNEDQPSRSCPRLHCRQTGRSRPRTVPAGQREWEEGTATRGEQQPLESTEGVGESGRGRGPPPSSSLGGGGQLGTNDDHLPLFHTFYIFCHPNLWRNIISIN